MHKIQPHFERNGAAEQPVRENCNLKSRKYVCITTYQPDTKSNPNPILTLTLLLNSTQ